MSINLHEMDTKKRNFIAFLGGGFVGRLWIVLCIFLKKPCLSNLWQHAFLFLFCNTTSSKIRQKDSTQKARPVLLFLSSNVQINIADRQRSLFKGTGWSLVPGLNKSLSADGLINLLKLKGQAFHHRPKTDPYDSWSCT